MRDAYATVAPRQRDYMQLQREQGVREYTPPPSPLPDGAALASTTCDAASLVGSSGRADGEAAGKPPPPLSLWGQTERVCEGVCVTAWVRVFLFVCLFCAVCVRARVCSRCSRSCLLGRPNTPETAILAGGPVGFPGPGKTSRAKTKTR